MKILKEDNFGVDEMQQKVENILIEKKKYCKNHNKDLKAMGVIYQQ